MSLALLKYRLSVPDIHNFFVFMIINPPYVLDIMDRAVAKCIETMANAEASNLPTRLFITVPDWLDTTYYKTLTDSRFLEHSIHHTAGKYYYEDSNSDDIRITATFNTTMFVLSYGLANEDYGKMTVAFMV